MNPFLSILVGVALLPGHATLVIASHNWWYGRLIGRRITDFVQVIHLVFLLLFSVYLFPRQWPFLPWGMYWGPFYLAAAFLGLVMLEWAWKRTERIRIVVEDRRSGYPEKEWNGGRVWQSNRR